MMNLTQSMVQRGLVTPEQADEAAALSTRTGGRADRALLELGHLDEAELLRFIGEQFALPTIDLNDVAIDAQVLQLLPAGFVHRRRVVPVRRADDDLTVAISDPFDETIADEVRLVTGLRAHLVLAEQEAIDRTIKSHFGIGGNTVDELIGTDDERTVDIRSDENDDLLEMAQEAGVIKLVNEILLEAIEQRASDIHIEPYENDLAVRYRIDGVLQPASVPAQIHRLEAAIISRIKIMAGLNIAEKRLPQDGRIALRVAGRQIDIRVSIIPTLFGEAVVMRVLDKSAVMLTLPQLGLADDSFRALRNLLAHPHGMILVTGPTGSGKTTTLYAALQAIISPGIKVLTIEDPIEYHLTGVNQMQVMPKIGLSFAAGLRAMLRHDPDVVMIGEIRDRETAEAAIQAAMTGHLVLSTLHTNDAGSAATRLLDMGIEPFRVSSTLSAAIAQRLVRTICRDCAQRYTPDPADLPAELALEPGQQLVRGAGCSMCRETGYRGRTGLYELLTMSEGVRDQIMARAPASRIIAAGRAEGLRLLREDGWLKVKAGLTTPEEVIASTGC